MSDKKAKRLDHALKQKAFYISGIAQMRIVQDVLDALESALTNGTTLEDFRDEIGDKLASAWGGDQPYRIENIFRTNIQKAYSAGRMAEMQDPAVKALRPYARFDATLDDATCPICGGLDGTVLALDEWDGRVPPLHFQCRCTLVSLSEDEVEQKEIGLDGDEPDALEGFGDTPDNEDTDVEDMTDFDPELLSAFNAKNSEG